MNGSADAGSEEAATGRGKRERREDSHKYRGEVVSLNLSSFSWMHMKIRRVSSFVGADTKTIFVA